MCVRVILSLSLSIHIYLYNALCPLSEHGCANCVPLSINCCVYYYYTILLLVLLTLRINLYINTDRVWLYIDVKTTRARKRRATTMLPGVYVFPDAGRLLLSLLADYVYINVTLGASVPEVVPSMSDSPRSFQIGRAHV